MSSGEHCYLRHYLLDILATTSNSLPSHREQQQKVVSLSTISSPLLLLFIFPLQIKYLQGFSACLWRRSLNLFKFTLILCKKLLVVGKSIGREQQEEFLTKLRIVKLIARRRRSARVG
jgi:hypothetical protein